MEWTGYRVNDNYGEDSWQTDSDEQVDRANEPNTPSYKALFYLSCNEIGFFYYALDQHVCLWWDHRYICWHQNGFSAV